MKWYVVVLVWASACLWSAVATASGGEHRVALLVWHDQGWKGTRPDQPLRYASRDAKLLARVLRTKGQFRTILLGQPTPDRLRRTLDLIEKKWSGTRKALHFLFYYSGHADARYLRLGPKSQRAGNRFSMKELAQFFKRLRARVKLGILDACNSGALIDLLHARNKGRGRGYAAFFQIPSALNQGMAILTSASAYGKAREIDRLRASLFTYHLTQGLWGKADLNLDGKVTSIEAYNYARLRMEKQLPGQQQPMYLNHFRGQGAYAITKSYNASVVLPVKRGEQYTVVGRHASWNIKVKDDRPRIVSVMAGSYRIYRRERTMTGFRCAVQQVNVSSQRRWLSRAAWKATTCPVSVAKGDELGGSLTDVVPLERPNRVGLSLSVGPLNASLFRPLWGGSLELVLDKWRLMVTFVGDQQATHFSGLLELAAGWGWRWEWGRWQLHVGGLVGLGILMVHHTEADLTGYSPSLRYGLQLEGGLRLRGAWWLLLQGFVGPAHTLVRGSEGASLAHALVGRGSLAIAYRF